MPATRSDQGVSAQGSHDSEPPSFERRGNCDDCGIVREADHRIANHLALLAGLVRLKAADFARRPAEVTGLDVQLVLDQISSQITLVESLHRSLSARETGEPDVGEHLHNVCVSLSALSRDVEIVESLTVGCHVRADQILPLTQIVSEVLTNAVKYGGPVQGRAIIRVRCSRNDDGAVGVEIADNGNGLPKGLDPAIDGGLGFRLLRTLARQLQASIEFNSGNEGMVVRLTLPRQRGLMDTGSPDDLS